MLQNRYASKRSTWASQTPQSKTKDHCDQQGFGEPHGNWRDPSRLWCFLLIVLFLIVLTMQYTSCHLMWASINVKLMCIFFLWSSWPYHGGSDGRHGVICIHWQFDLANNAQLSDITVCICSFGFNCNRIQLRSWRLRLLIKDPTMAAWWCWYLNSQPSS